MALRMIQNNTRTSFFYFLSHIGTHSIRKVQLQFYQLPNGYRLFDYDHAQALMLIGEQPTMIAPL